MAQFQKSEWSSDSTSPQQEHSLVNKVNAWKTHTEETTINPTKTIAQAGKPWSIMLQGLLFGALLGGVAFSAVLTIWLKTSVFTTTSAVTSVTISSTTTTFSTGWNTTGITVAGVTNSPGVGSNQFAQPFCIVVGPSNALYITDQPNHRVQQYVVNATSGTTVAGQSSGTAGSALNYLSYPSGLAVDQNGNIYVVDGGNERIVYWANGASTGSLVAGTGVTGSANNQFNNPAGISVDWTTGTLYISDTGNHRIMQYLSGASSGTVVAGGNGAGTGGDQLNYPRGVYYDSSTNSLLIANNHACNIVRWVVGASNWTLVAGSGSGVSGTSSTLLNYPTDMILDSLGNMYVSDEGNQRIQLFLSAQSTGITIAGVTGTSGSTAQLFYTPSSLALDSQFNIYVTDYNNYRVQKFLHY